MLNILPSSFSKKTLGCRHAVARRVSCFLSDVPECTGVLFPPVSEVPVSSSFSDSCSEPDILETSSMKGIYMNKRN